MAKSLAVKRRARRRAILDKRRALRRATEEKLKTVDKKGYYQYINSPEWQAKRQLKLRKEKHRKCYVCDEPYKPGFHMHHLHYRTLGGERPKDLVAVCPKHHDVIHKFQKWYKLMTIQNVTQLTRRYYQRQQMSNKQSFKHSRLAELLEQANRRV